MIPLHHLPHDQIEGLGSMQLPTALAQLQGHICELPKILLASITFSIIVILLTSPHLACNSAKIASNFS